MAYTHWSEPRPGQGPHTKLSVNRPFSTDCQRQCCDIGIIKLLRFLINQASHSKNDLQPQLIRYYASVDADVPNQSLT